MVLNSCCTCLEQLLSLMALLVLAEAYCSCTVALSTASGMPELLTACWGVQAPCCGQQGACLADRH